MSYSFTVTKKDGEVTITGADSEYVPDNAEWFVNGHEDADNISLSVYRKVPGAFGTLAYAATSAARGGGTA